MKKRGRPKSRGKRARAVVRLEDLAPRRPVQGGARRLLFGERLDAPEDEAPGAAKDRTRPPD
ncbi:MAG TPA: hypothetical protein VIG69_06445 [Candidatus Methylomirabilis sp.]